MSISNITQKTGRAPLLAGAAAALLLVGGGALPAVMAADAPAAASVNTQDPGQLVKDVADNILKELDAHRDQYRNNPGKLRELADRYLLPYFDIDYSAQLVLGKYWRSATPDQRMRFINAFQNSLLQNYGNAVVEFRSNQLKVLPTRNDPGATNATVRTEITKNDGSVTHVVYVLHKTGGGWKAWDVVIEGISYVKSFRDDFGAQIEQSGLEAVIKRLESGAKPANLPAPAK